MSQKFWKFQPDKTLWVIYEWNVENADLKYANSVEWGLHSGGKGLSGDVQNSVFTDCFGFYWKYSVLSI